MKRIFVIGAVAFLFACGNSTPKQENTTATDSTATAAVGEQFFGDKITGENAQPIAELKTLMGDKTELPVKLQASVDAVCQKKGCWMDLKTAEGETMRVTFKDYGFFVPKDAAGKEAIVEGVAKIEETSVADLKEYAKDAGKSKEEIEAIKEPKKELVFEASGVILK
ncbi:hypothetical protein AEM51_10285 [Bacteroidetes bacterium UKL13-3]|jgi:hypothetical protein|nr:hypothetical protein AEM51_10285 [Bacteroidetes bacterium UKL13-3]HCP94124.1 DUF4920 domain-containing protein [Bacteroidota bacterium]